MAIVRADNAGRMLLKASFDGGDTQAEIAVV